MRRFALIGAALSGEDGVRDVTTAPRNDAAAVAIGGKSWPLDIRLRPRVFRPHMGLLTLRYLAGGEVRAFATNGLESGRFQGFLTCNMSDQVITVRCGNFFPIPPAPVSVTTRQADKSSHKCCTAVVRPIKSDAAAGKLV